ncbi:MAG: hypothetical protein ABJG68_15695 [Crocinitomicaceae bacterium]
MKKGLFLIAAVGIVLFATVSNMDSVQSKKLAGTDKYKVIKVDGKIVFEQTKESMKKGDIFLSGMALSFQTPQSRAAVISSLKGRFVLSASEKGQTKILPAANNISSRAGALINMVDLQNHFAGKYLVLGSMELELGEEAFPMGEQSFFYLSYEHKGEQIRKKLSHHDNKLMLNEKEIFKIDGQPIPIEEKEMALYYRADGQSTKISEFTPVFPDLHDLKDEVAIILAEFSEKDKATKIKEVTSYLNEFYGNPQKENLTQWLEKEFDL